MLRISRTETPDTDDRLLLRIEGHVRGRWVDELRRACEEAIAGNGRASSPCLVLDLAGVLFIDASGLSLFRELSARRIQITNCSPFVAEQLKEVADGCC